MKFKNLVLSEWRQFERIDVEFHSRLTVITGANGSGKSTLLRLLSTHFGLGYQLLATPTLDGGVRRYIPGFFRKWLNINDPNPWHTVGHLIYSNGQTSSIQVPSNIGVQYNANFSQQQSTPGLHIGSHRPIPTYQQVGSIPTNAIGAEQAYQMYWQEMVNRYNGGNSSYSPIFRMKEAIISMAMFGPGNRYVQRDESIEKLFNEFKAVLARTLPPTIGFRDISIRIPDVVVVTDTGDFLIDAASGGLMSLIDLSWQIFLFSRGKEEFVVTLDEPENHLHPSMQRALLSRLIAAFPNAQFVVATHSPFIVSSVKDSTVYVLKYLDLSTSDQSEIGRKVTSLKLDTANKAGSAGEILRDVLGVPVTLPEWAEDDLRAISSRYSISRFNSEEINELRESLDRAGLSEYYPEALRQIAGAR